MQNLTSDDFPNCFFNSWKHLFLIVCFVLVDGLYTFLYFSGNAGGDFVFYFHLFVLGMLVFISSIVFINVFFKLQIVKNKEQDFFIEERKNLNDLWGFFEKFKEICEKHDMLKESIEKQIKMSENDLRTIINGVNGVFYRFKVLDGRLGEVDYIDNSVFSVLKIQGDTFDYEKMIFEDDIAMWKKEVGNCLKRKKMADFDHRFLIDGRVVWVNNKFNPVFSEETGEINFIEGIFFDISDIVALKGDFARNQYMFDVLFQNFPFGVIVHNQNMEIVSYNNKIIELYGDKDLRGQCCFYLFQQGASLPCMGCAVKKSFLYKKTYTSINKHCWQGDCYYLELVSSPVVDESGDVFSVLTIVRDVTSCFLGKYSEVENVIKTYGNFDFFVGSDRKVSGINDVFRRSLPILGFCEDEIDGLNWLVDKLSKNGIHLNGVFNEKIKMFLDKKNSKKEGDFSFHIENTNLECIIRSVDGGAMVSIGLD